MAGKIFITTLLLLLLLLNGKANNEEENDDEFEPEDDLETSVNNNDAGKFNFFSKINLYRSGREIGF